MSQNRSSTDWKERRRLQALELQRQGWRQKDIATALGVTKGAVSQWLAASFRTGRAALLARPHTGRPAELTSEEKWVIPELLSHGAEAYGFRGAVWTTSRVGKVLEWEFGVSYHKSHIARLLKEVNWTPQMPLAQATQRDEVAIARWRSEVWEELKKSAAGAENPCLCGRIGLLPPPCDGSHLCALRSDTSAAGLPNPRPFVCHERDHSRGSLVYDGA